MYMSLFRCVGQKKTNKTQRSGWRLKQSQFVQNMRMMTIFSGYNRDGR